MKTLLLSFLLLLIVMPAAAAFPSTAVWAVGAPTDNYTIPDLPTNDPTHDEKKPAVNYYLRDVTAQTKTSPASFIASFTGPLDRNNYKVVGERQWYLDIDINTPGWLYIYEYYPPNNNPSGQWVAYKWQLKQSGIWQIGPFNAKPDEPEGQHIYRIWFYGNGQWATTDSDKLSSLIYWAYLKDFPELKILSFSASYQQIKRGDNVTLSWNALGAETLEILNVGPVTGASGSITVVPGSETDYVLVATGLDGRQIKSNTVKVLVSEPSATQYPPTVVTQPPAETPSLLDQLSAPVTLISILSVIVIIILGLLLRMVYLKRWANNEPEATPIIEQQVETVQEEKPAITVSAADEEPAATKRAKLILPGGLQINLAAGSRAFGRADVARALGLDDLCLISRTQFHLSYKDGNYWIEDAGSINGTMLNGEETRGKGAIILKDGDIIEPAGTIKIKFTVMEP